jgi:hypothetical protein
MRGRKGRGKVERMQVEKEESVGRERRTTDRNKERMIR